MSLFAASRRQTKAVFSSFSRPDNVFLVERILGRVRARAFVICLRYLFGGNHGRNYVSMGIVWQQVGKISTHRLSTTTTLTTTTIRVLPSLHLRCIGLHRVTQFRSRRPSSDLASRCRGCWSSNQFAVLYENRESRGKSTIVGEIVACIDWRDALPRIE